jgi:hypothetical protein
MRSRRLLSARFDVVLLKAKGLQWLHAAIDKVAAAERFTGQTP